MIADQGPAAPYLSVIATSRNDDHGGLMLQRMQAFVEGLCGQAERFGLNWELILVEWNPPGDRLPLSQALTWPSKKGPLKIRIIQVPDRLHFSLEHADKMGLFQMIAKNAGARRANGRFLLFTNIDILFNDSLVSHLSRKDLESQTVYRIDRNDVRNEVPIGKGVEALLAWAATHQIRRHRKDGSYRVKPDGELLYGSAISPDFVPVSGFMSMMEKGSEALYMKPRAQLVLRAKVTRICLIVGLADEITELGQLVLEIRNSGGELLLTKGITAHPDHCQLPMDGSTKGWQVVELTQDLAGGTVLSLEVRGGSLPFDSSTWNCLRIGCINSQKVTDSRNAPFFVLGKGWHQWEKDLKAGFFRWAESKAYVSVSAKNPHFRFQIGPGPSLNVPGGHLLAYQGDQLLGDFALNCSRVIDLFPRGSGDPEHLALIRLEVNQPLDPFEPDPKKRVMGFQGLKFQIQECTFFARFSAWINQAWFDWLRPWIKGLVKKKAPVSPLQQTNTSRKLMKDPGDTFPPFAKIGDLDSCLGFSVGYFPGLESVQSTRSWHTNGCGDFTLLSRQDFDQLGGYWEYHGFSMHIDSLFLFAAQAAGFKEVVLEEPMAIYHIEHNPGSGFTPEAADQMYERVRMKKLPYLTEEEVERLHQSYFQGKGPFNPVNWGFSDIILNEIIIE